MSSASSPVRAAGAVLWRVIDGKLRILLISRPRHDRDVSIPKGKVDPGEIGPDTAVREIEEETGYHVTLGVKLGTARYTIGNNRPKTVDYWAAHVSDAEFERNRFTANDEVDSIEWVSVKKAFKLVTYDTDRDILHLFADLAAKNDQDSFALIVLRHGSAEPGFEWEGPDETRPLTRHGKQQAALDAPLIAAFGPETIVTSTATRCEQTVEPTSSLTGVRAEAVEGLSQRAFEAGEDSVRECVDELLQVRQTALVCSHGPVIPEIVRAVHQASGASGTRHNGIVSTAEFLVVHLSRTSETPEVLAIETFSPEI